MGDNANSYNVYLYDPVETYTQVPSMIHSVTSGEELDEALAGDASGGVEIHIKDGNPNIVLYAGTEKVDRHRADYAFSLLHSGREYKPETMGHNNPEMKQRREITCELLFIEIAAVGFLGIASVLFKEKQMGVICVHAIMPLKRRLFVFSKIVLFLLTDLAFAALLTLLTATPVFLSANTAIKLDWVIYHPFYHVYMGQKNAFFGTPVTNPVYYICVECVIILVWKDKFCIMSFLLPIVAAVLLNIATREWLLGYGDVTVCPTREEWLSAIREPSTNLIGVEGSGEGIRTVLAGGELPIWQQAAATLPALYEQRKAAAEASIQTLEQPDVLAGFQFIFIAMILIVAMFMGCTFNAMNIISEKEDGFVLGCLSAMVTAAICFKLSPRGGRKNICK